MKRSFAAATASGLRAARARIAWCMVGTAVYQVGFASPSQRKEAQRIEAGRAERAAAGRERGEHGRDQPVDMEQRHDVEAAVVRRQRQRRADMAGGGARLAWLSGTSFGREVVPEVWRRSATSPSSARPGRAASPPAAPSSVNGRPARGIGHEAEDGDAAAFRDRDRRPASPAATISALAPMSQR